MDINEDGEFEEPLKLTETGEYTLDVNALKKEELIQVLDEVPTSGLESE